MLKILSKIAIFAPVKMGRVEGPPKPKRALVSTIDETYILKKFPHFYWFPPLLGLWDLASQSKSAKSSEIKKIIGKQYSVVLLCTNGQVISIVFMYNVIYRLPPLLVPIIIGLSW